MARSSFAVASVPKLGPDFATAVASRQATEWLISGGIFGEDEHPSVVIRKHSEPGDRIGEVYMRMRETDAVLAGLLEKRTDAVVGLPWSMVPGDESPEAQRIADLCTEMLYGIRSLETNLAHQLSSISDGVAFDEMRWERIVRGRLAGMWAVVELTDRPMWRFGFKDGVLCIRQKDGTLKPAPPFRIMHTAHGTKDSPWGRALLDNVWWFYFLSLHAWKYAGVAMEKWAQPVVKVTYDEQSGTGDSITKVNEENKAAALAVARDIQTDFAVALPAGIDVGLIEASRGGHIEYSGFLQLLDRAKALVFLGEIDTSGLSPGPGSFAKNRVSNEVRYEKILADAAELANSITDNLIKPFVWVNFGLDAPMPWFEFDVEEASDRALRQNGAQEVLNRGLPVAETYMYRVHQVPVPKPGERVFRDPQIVGTVTVDREEDVVEQGTAPLPKRRQPQPVETKPAAPAAAAAHWSHVELRGAA